MYRQRFKIRWSDCDANGHVANTAYSTYGTETRIGYLASMGWTYQSFLENRIGPVLLREEIDYLAELFMGEEIEVDFTALGLSPDESRFRLRHDFFRADGKPVARIVLLGGWLDLTRRRLAPPPPRLAEIIRSVPRSEDFAPILPGGLPSAKT
jgi:acyl-CoA thioester hydrolase